MAEPLFDPTTGKARDMERLRSHGGRAKFGGVEVTMTSSSRITREWSRHEPGRVTVDVGRYDATTGRHEAIA